MRALRLILALVLGLALLTWAASVLVSRTTRQWFERDIQLRARLAVAGAREALVSHWGPGRKQQLARILAEISRDERIMAAGACGRELRLLAHAGEYPDELACAIVGPRVRPTADSSSIAWSAWAARLAAATRTRRRCRSSTARTPETGDARLASRSWNVPVAGVGTSRE